jgi:hypothetical protein
VIRGSGSLLTAGFKSVDLNATYLRCSCLSLLHVGCNPSLRAQVAFDLILNGTILDWKPNVPLACAFHDVYFHYVRYFKEEEETMSPMHRTRLLKYPLKWLPSALAFVALNAPVVHASPILISGSVTGAASVDLMGRCAPFPTVSAVGSGFGTGLGNFTDTQSHCTNGNFSFSQGTFDLVSTDSPQNSLFGTYDGTASLQNELLDFNAALLVTGGTGLFANDSGTLLSVGALNENTGAFSASFSGSVAPTPEPSSFCLIGVGIATFLILQLHRDAKLEKNDQGRSDWASDSAG